MMGILSFMHLGGMLLVETVNLEWLPRAGLWVLLGLSLYRSLRLHALRNAPRAIEALEIDRENIFSVKLKGAKEWRSCRLSSRFIHPWITMLVLRIDSRWWPENLVIVADAVETESFRRWRARLKLQSAVA